VDIGDVDSKALRLELPVSVVSATGTFPSRDTIKSTLLSAVPAANKDALTDFILRVYAVYVHLHFTYLEINPLVALEGGEIHFLDMATKIDQTAESICGPIWAVARDLTLYEEAYIQKLDASTGASLKLAVLNPTGRIWTMVAGGRGAC
jgi:ATP citrate (pro-S)-lyase